MEAEVDCLVTGDRTATFTAVVTRADPQVADRIGQRLGITCLRCPRRRRRRKAVEMACRPLLRH
jgi:hypothetical protein